MCIYIVRWYKNVILIVQAINYYIYFNINIIYFKLLFQIYIYFFIIFKYFEIFFWIETNSDIKQKNFIFNYIFKKYWKKLVVRESDKR